ncbi:hypothetical protein FRB99_008700 [Tulasnella sp. 403]|nr:hypothetical protein FRB99_008700 [Tulasnella sp. 403]
MSTEALERKLAEALANLKPFCLNKSWIRVSKTDSEIGIGGFGIVHRATLQKRPFAPKVHIAVKKLHTIGEWEDLLRVALALVQELDVWTKLNHPNILPLLGFHLSSGLNEAWLVSPYESNGNIFEYLERTQLGLDGRLELAKDTAKGLEYLHTRIPPICHGDIKSLNVLIDVSGHALLCDFGLAQAADVSAVSTKSRSANDRGTIRYWSPERFEEDSHPTLKADIWAWGCLLLEIITGLPPYHHIMLEGRLVHVISNKTLPTRLDDVAYPPHIRDVLVACWEIKPESRPTMTQVLGSLIAGNAKFYRSESLLPIAPGVSSAHLDKMERELADVLSPLEKYRVNPGWFEIPTSGSAIGSGGFGVVYRGTMRPNRRRSKFAVAVKKLRSMGGRDKSLRMVILQEAWLVAPLMSNGNLSQYLLTSNLSMDERLALALDTAKGLQYLHNHDPPICHGDIKAVNVLINKECRAVLCDFGLAKTMENMPSGLTTSTFNQAGTLSYESPELLLGTSLRVRESDVWAWGCLLQEIFSGKAPYYWANNQGAIVKFITQDIPPAVLEDINCTSLVRRLLGCCWQSRPALRPSMDQCVVILTNKLPRTSLLAYLSRFPAADVAVAEFPGHNSPEFPEDIDPDLPKDTYPELFDNRRKDDVPSVLQELEKRAVSVWVEDMMVKRSQLNFDEASRIGSGSFGTVYEGKMSKKPPIPGDAVAIRQFLPPRDETNVPDEVIRRFILRLRMRHVNILEIIGYCTDPSPTGELLLIFPYVSKFPIDTYLGRNALGNTRKMALATEIAEALLYLHTRSPPIIHGRVHPRNILMDNAGRPLLCDYGLGEFASYFRTAPATLESLRYQSPEAVIGMSSSTVRGDVWSYGCILLLIASGHTPYRDANEVDWLRQLLEQKINPVPLDDLNYHNEHIDLLRMCWTWDPPSRPTMGDVIAILTKVFSLVALRFSRDGKALAVGSANSITIHDTHTGDLACELVEPKATTELRGMEFSRSGRLLVGLKPPDVLVWDLTTRKIRQVRAFDRTSGPKVIDVSSDDTFCVAGCDNGMIHVWDIDDKEKSRSTSLIAGLRVLAISPGRDVVAVGMLDTGVRILSTRTLETLAKLDCRLIWTIRFSPDGDLLFGAGDDLLARCWNVASIKEGTSEEGEKQISCLRFTGHKRSISSVSGNSTWYISISDGGEVHAANLAPDATGGETQHIGNVPPTFIGRRMDLSPVSEEGSGYAVAHSGGSAPLIVWKYTCLLHRNE